MWHRRAAAKTPPSGPEGVLTLPSAALPPHLRLGRSLAFRLQRALTDAVDVSPTKRSRPVKPLPALAVTAPSALVRSPCKGLVLSGWEKKEAHLLDCILEPSVGPEKQVSFQMERCHWELECRKSFMDEEMEGEPNGLELPPPSLQILVSDASAPSAASPPAELSPGPALEAVTEETCALQLPRPPAPEADQLGPCERASEAPTLGWKRCSRGARRAKGTAEAVGHRSFATQPTMNRQVSASSAGTENSSDGETTPWVETKQSERLVTEDLEAAIAESASPRSVPGREMRPPWLPQWPRRLHNPTALPRATRMFRNITPAPAPAAAAMRSVARRDGRCGVRFRAGRRRRDLASPQLEVNDDGTFDYPSARSWYTRKRFVKALSRETSLAKVRSSPAPGKQPAEEEEVGGDGREGSSEGEGEGSRSRSRPTSVAASRPDSARSRTDRSRANSEDGVPARTASLTFLRRRCNSVVYRGDGEVVSPSSLGGRPRPLVDGESPRSQSAGTPALETNASWGQAGEVVVESDGSSSRFEALSPSPSSARGVRKPARSVDTLLAAAGAAVQRTSQRID